MPCSRTGVVDASVVQRLEEHRAAAADDAVVLDADHQPVLAGQVDERRVDRLDPARVDDGHADALRGQPPGDLDGGRAPSRRRRRCSTSLAPLRTSTSTPPALPTAAMSSGGGPLGNRTTVGASSTSTAS